MENKNQNEKTQNSMEILENVIKSNKEVIASNAMIMEFFAGLKGDIEDLTGIIGEAQFSASCTNGIYEDLKKFFNEEQTKREEFLASIPTETETVFSQETFDSMANFEKKIRRMKNLIWTGFGVVAFAVLVLIISINFSTNWYKESIKAKSELRQEILDEIATDGKKIYDENDIKTLKENSKLIRLWIKNSPKKAEDFLRFKEGYEAK